MVLNPCPQFPVTCFDDEVTKPWADGKGMAYGLHKVSLGAAMPCPCRRATPKTTSRLFQGLSAHRAGNLRPSSTFLDTPCRTPLDKTSDEKNRSETDSGSIHYSSRIKGNMGIRAGFQGGSRGSLE
jgi:hypothetical protein